MNAPVELDLLKLRELDPRRIVVGARIRKDLGDLAELAASIEQLGQLHPIVIRRDRTLVCGERRLRACALVGRKVLARVVDTAQEALEALDAEGGENRCRKAWTASEAYEYAQRRLELEREAAAERKAEGRRKGGRAKAAASGSAVPEAQPDAEPKGDEQGRAATRAATSAGFGSRKELERVGQVVEAARAEPERFGPLLEELDKGGKPSAVVAKLERLRDGCDSDSYGTPPWVPDGIRKVEGRRISLDPATNKNSIALGFIDARVNWTIEDDALVQPTWDVDGDGNTLVFMNPKYSDPAELVERLVAEWDAGHLGRAYALVKLDTSTTWWAALRERAAAIVLPRKRVAHYVGSKPRKGSDFCSGMPVLARGTRGELLDLWGRLIDAFEADADVYLSPWVRKAQKSNTTTNP